jgi:ABC-type sulfate/molybdate transport systems ATPase subunit
MSHFQRSMAPQATRWFPGSRSGCTSNAQTVMVTHEAADAFAIGAKVALLQEGRMVAQRPANDVLLAERDRPL